MMKTKVHACTFHPHFWSPDLPWPSSLRMTLGQYTSQPHFLSCDTPWAFSLRMVHCLHFNLAVVLDARCHQCQMSHGGTLLLYLFVGVRIACWLECRTRDQKVASLIPWQKGWENFLLQSQLCLLTLTWCLFNPHVTAVTRKRPRSFCQKCRWQATPRHAYTFDPTKLEWADYAAVQA